ncbi:hypothetical protein C8J56DRAFT_1042001 [Mycena floridula]|nr:hypothetical protein C8J56DRAFT_1042001 [Mycena floridula]
MTPDEQQSEMIWESLVPRFYFIIAPQGKMNYRQYQEAYFLVGVFCDGKRPAMGIQAFNDRMKIFLAGYIVNLQEQVKYMTGWELRVMYDELQMHYMNAIHRLRRLCARYESYLGARQAAFPNVQTIEEMAVQLWRIHLFSHIGSNHLLDPTVDLMPEFVHHATYKSSDINSAILTLCALSVSMPLNPTRTGVLPTTHLLRSIGLKSAKRVHIFLNRSWLQGIGNTRQQPIVVDEAIVVLDRTANEAAISCPICLDVAEMPYIIQCGHSYCICCILKLLLDRSPGHGVKCPKPFVYTMPANRSTRTQNEPVEVSANFSPIQRPSVRLSFGNLDESLLEVPLAARPEAPTDQSLVESSSLLLPSLIPSTAVSPPKASSLSVAADVSDLPDWASFMDNDAQMLDFFSGAALLPTDIAPGAETAASSLPSTVPIPVFPNGPSVLAPDEIPPVTMQRSFPSVRWGFPSTTPANNTPQQPVSTPVSVEPYVEAPFSRLDDYKDRLTPEGVYAKLMAYFAAADLNETERSKTAAFAQFGTDFHGYAASYGDHTTYKRENPRQQPSLNSEPIFMDTQQVMGIIRLTREKKKRTHTS